VNDDLARAVARVAAIVDAEGQRVARQDGLVEFIAGIRRQVLAEAARFPVS
jgi:hypothetical protein